jgi:hypothetical protein
VAKKVLHNNLSCVVDALQNVQPVRHLSWENVHHRRVKFQLASFNQAHRNCGCEELGHTRYGVPRRRCDLGTSLVGDPVSALPTPGPISACDCEKAMTDMTAPIDCTCEQTIQTPVERLTDGITHLSSPRRCRVK